MAATLYDISVGNYLQTLDAASVFLQKGLEHCTSNGIDLDELVEAQLYSDMLPFRFQVACVVHHSRRVIDMMASGIFSLPGDRGPRDYRALQELVADAQKILKKLTPADINKFEGTDMAYQQGSLTLPFKIEDFILSFSLPQFYFHAATAYDILRMKGVPVGKRDFLGQLRLKSA